MNYVAELRALVGTRPLILPGTSVLILNPAGQVLLVERTDVDGWGLPGGLMEPGESFEEVGRREVREELGIEMGPMSLLEVFSGPEMYFRYDHGDEIYNVTAVYITTTEQSSEIAPDEIRTARFFAPEDFPDDILAPERPILDLYAAQIRASAFGGLGNGHRPVT